mmetsp:Transcript_13701/g.30284  ORF Transcript_13701/g.30284 Transcript_13701/m.30284 type:complete len:249 (+) Transcript_13701:1609-2355(+)
MSMAEISLSLARLKISLSAFLGPWPWPFRLGSVCFIPCASSESRFESPGSLAFSFLAYFFRDCKKSSRVFASKYCRIMTSNTEMSLNRLTTCNTGATAACSTSGQSRIGRAKLSKRHTAQKYGTFSPTNSRSSSIRQKVGRSIPAVTTAPCAAWVELLQRCMHLVIRSTSVCVKSHDICDPSTNFSSARNAFCLSVNCFAVFSSSSRESVGIISLISMSLGRTVSKADISANSRPSLRWFTSAVRRRS